MRRILLKLAISLAFLPLAIGAVVGSAEADAPRVQISEADLDLMRDWVAVPVTIATLRGLNAEQNALSQADIDALDKEWRAERERIGDRPLVAELMARPLSNYLLRRQAMAGGLYTEIFVVTDRGLNAGQSAVTGDYWQGDEAKFTKTFEVGADAVFIDEAELHEASGTWRQQVNFTIPDPETGAPIGAVTIEINLTELARRRAL
ncbi:hypothetical protein [Algihabitans albus]|uniref:hypothetical protein n=1 Tax=Algihabitans albus TaxID=2164067 RepID=UPI000E5C6BBF|nr:hypothetical protein [Algihabitans albus]